MDFDCIMNVLDTLYDFICSHLFLVTIVICVFLFGLNTIYKVFNGFTPISYILDSFSVNTIEVDAEEAEVSSEGKPALLEPKSSYKIDLTKKDLTPKQQEKLIFHNDGRVTLCSKKLLRF